MFKFITMIFLMFVAFCAGRISASEFPIFEEIPVTVQEEEIPYSQLSNNEIMALIRNTRLQEDSPQKYAQIAALLAILRGRMAEQNSSF